MRALYHAVPEARKKEAGVDDLLVAPMGAVKAMGEGRIRVSLVPFGSQDDLDSDGEFFDEATDFDREFPAKMSLWWAHGQDDEIADRRLGYVEVKTSKEDLWFEHQLDLSDAYESKMYELAKMGRLGGSSGAVSHLVKKSRAGKGVHLDRWPLGEASILVTPAHPGTRGRTMALKSCEPISLDDALSAADWNLPPSLAEDLGRVADEVERVKARCAGIKAGQAQFSRSRREAIERLRDELSALLDDITPDRRDVEIEASPDPGPGEGAAERTDEQRGVRYPVTIPDLSDLYAGAVRQSHTPFPTVSNIS